VYKLLEVRKMPGCCSEFIYQKQKESGRRKERGEQGGKQGPNPDKPSGAPESLWDLLLSGMNKDVVVESCQKHFKLKFQAGISMLSLKLDITDFCISVNGGSILPLT
jgi:hypothetical protein